MLGRIGDGHSGEFETLKGSKPHGAQNCLEVKTNELKH
jgi:hypothetical protein